MNEWKKGKIPESAGDEPEGGNTVLQKLQTVGSKTLGFKSHLSQFLVGGLCTSFVTDLGLSCIVCEVRRTMILIKYNSSCLGH